MEKTNINWDMLKASLTEQAIADLRKLIGSAVGDLAGIGADIARLQVDVLREPDDKRQALQDELVGQLRVLGETHRIELNEAGWAQFTNLIVTGLSVASRVLIVAATAV